METPRVSRRHAHTVRKARRNAMALAAAALVSASSAPLQAQSSTRVCAEAASSGQLQRDRGKLIDARASFVICAQPTCPKVIQKDCAGWQRDVDERIPTVVLSAKDDLGNDLNAFTVTLDGAPFSPAADGRSTPIDPGSHTFRFTVAGHRPQERVFVAREGERARAVSAVLERLVKSGVGKTGVDKNAGIKTNDATNRDAKSDEAANARRDDGSPPSASGGPGPLPFILGGAGLVGGVTFVVLFTGIKSDTDELVGTPAYTEDTRSELQSRLVVADVIGAVSAVALVTAGLLFATSWSASRARVTLLRGPTLGGGATTSAMFRF